MRAFASVASELPQLREEQLRGADTLGSWPLACQLREAHFIRDEPAHVFIDINYMFFLIAMRPPTHLQPSSAELHCPWRVSGATRVRTSQHEQGVRGLCFLRCRIPRESPDPRARAGRAVRPGTSLPLGRAQLGSKG